MANFKYEIKQADGKISTGVIGAQSSAAAAQMLKSQGAYIVSMTEIAQKKAKSFKDLANIKIQFGPGAKDVLNFTSQLAVMIKAGISIRAALEAIVDQVDNEKFQDILQQIKRDVEGGKAFSEALAQHPKVFSALYVNMVQASELSGSFGSMLDRIAEYQEQQIETQSQVKSAMVYPIIIAVMAVLTTVFMLTYVLPKFVVIFEGKEDMLPTPTKIILAISDVFRHQWYLVIGGVVGAAWLFLYIINTTWGRAWWDATKLRIPIFKKLCRSLYICRSLQTMGELVNAGVPMLDTINITANVSGNTIYKNMWKKVANAVRQGKKIATPLTSEKLLPSSVVQMISSGEESGKLADVLGDISTFYNKELKTTIRAVTSMIEPLMIVVMGCVVGFIAMSIVLPIFKMSSMVKG